MRVINVRPLDGLTPRKVQQDGRLALSDRIADALAVDRIDVEEIEALAVEAKAEIARLKSGYEALETRMLDPMIFDADAVALKNERDLIGLRVSRLEAGLGALAAAKRDDDDEEALRRQRYDEARAARDAAVEAIRERYPAIATQLLDLIETIQRANAKVSRANSDCPRDADPLEKAEGVARGFNQIVGTKNRFDPPLIAHMTVPGLEPTMYPIYPPISRHNRMYVASWEECERDEPLAREPSGPSLGRVEADAESD